MTAADCQRTFLSLAAGQDTMQVINIWKANLAFASVVLSPELGEVVAKVAGCVLLQSSLTASSFGILLLKVFC